MSGWDTDYTYEPSPLFEQTFRCLPFSKYSNPDLQTGDKIIMPPSALSRILELGLRHPFTFKIEGFKSDKTSHCGVLQFDAEEGFVHVPDWMMKNLNLNELGCVIVRDARLSRGVHMKLQPHTTSFVELGDPKDALEKGLKGFTCLSRGDTFAVKHEGGREFYFDVLEVYPGDAISLIDTDCLLDLAPPLDYVEPTPPTPPVCNNKPPFSGRGRRLDGMAVTVEEEKENKEAKDGGKDLEEKDGGKYSFKPFTGRSRVLGGRPLF